MSNPVVILLAALAPMVVGFIWYNPKVFGSAWMKAVPITDEQIQGANMALIFGLAYLFACLLAFSLLPLVIHQASFQSLLFGEMQAGGDAAAAAEQWLESSMAKYGHIHRSFGHGALHGGIAAIALVLPTLGTNALFERKNWKYILINVGYWFVSMSIMGGIVCQFYNV